MRRVLTLTNIVLHASSEAIDSAQKNTKAPNRYTHYFLIFLNIPTSWYLRITVSTILFSPKEFNVFYFILFRTIMRLFNLEINGPFLFGDYE